MSAIARPNQSAAIRLTTPIEVLPGVGPRKGAEFRRLGMPTIAHLIHTLPTRYERHAAETAISDLKPGEIITARGEVTATRVAGRPGRQRFEAVLMDHSARLDLVWFNGAYLRRRIHPGMRLRVQGRSKRLGANLQLANPAWEALPDETDPDALEARIRPIYPASEALTSRAIEAAIESCLDAALPLLQDHLPEPFRRERALPSLADAYRMLHRPADLEEAAEARRRLAYDELLLLQLGVHMKRAHQRRTMKAPALRFTKTIDDHIRKRVPFALTTGQESAVAEIAADLQKPTPANRLIQGDVGAGKTVVALYAMLMAVASRHQAALMAPTELLAEQHFATLTELLRGSDVSIGLITGAVIGPDRQRLLADAARGDIDILVGTHALLTEHVRFQSLAVAVIDEQHRFGVHQRARLRAKGEDASLAPHVLVMTATPIPRTLSLTVFGDLDVSTIKGLPPGRKPVTTRLVPFDTSDTVYAYIRERIDQGEQAYIVVPAVESESAGGLRDVRSTVKRLEDTHFAGKRIAGIHGRLKRSTREHLMARFRAGQIDCLVATTVIEVGVDVPNASIMVVEHAERFGLAQLHQLRGRIGRGRRKGLCVLIAEPVTEESQSRLKVMLETTDGFRLAERDLEIRGPGELLGARQSGLAPFRAADLPQDLDLLLMARRDAAAWIDRSPALAAPEETLLRTRLLKAHGETLGLADVA